MATNQASNVRDDALCISQPGETAVGHQYEVCKCTKLFHHLLTYFHPHNNVEELPYLTMGAWFSVPVLGYLLMPSLGTYSTSLNLLFFYMTWSTLVLSQTPMKVEIIGTIAVRVVFFMIPSALFFLFDTLLPSLAVGIKRQGASALPTRTGSVAGARKGDGRPQWYRVVGLSLFNICLGVIVQAGVEILFTVVFQSRSALKVTTRLPMPWSIAKELIRTLLLREACPSRIIHLGISWTLTIRF